MATTDKKDLYSELVKFNTITSQQDLINLVTSNKDFATQLIAYGKSKFRQKFKDRAIIEMTLSPAAISNSASALDSKIVKHIFEKYNQIISGNLGRTTTTELNEFYLSMSANQQFNDFNNAQSGVYIMINFESNVNAAIIEKVNTYVSFNHLFLKIDNGNKIVNYIEQNESVLALDNDEDKIKMLYNIFNIHLYGSILPVENKPEKNIVEKIKFLVESGVDADFIILFISLALSQGYKLFDVNYDETQHTGETKQVTGRTKQLWYFENCFIMIYVSLFVKYFTIATEDKEKPMSEEEIQKQEHDMQVQIYHMINNMIQKSFHVKKNQHKKQLEKRK